MQQKKKKKEQKQEEDLLYFKSNEENHITKKSLSLWPIFRYGLQFDNQIRYGIA